MTPDQPGSPLALRVEGPAFELQRVLKPGEVELVLGRDADCAICLPDPQRTVSRRHLAVWNEAGELHFRVLSIVNGVEMSFGEAPPGARGVLPVGQVLKLAEYNVSVTAAAAPAEPEPDPWAVFDRDGSGVAPVPEAVRASLAAGPAEDDPFGEWGFETTSGPGGAGGGALNASQFGVAADLVPFFRGLGIEGAPLSEGELESIGRLVRATIEGLLDLRRAATGLTDDLRAEDRTMVAARDPNPLKDGRPLQATLQYLFAGRAAAGGALAPERAMRQLLEELLAHELAVGPATRAAVEGMLGEFAPAELKANLLGGGTKLFEAARAWEAYSRYYTEQGGQMPEWVQRMIDKYFTAAYLQERERLKRETSGRPR